jgi:hypothetical protein
MLESFLELLRKRGATFTTLGSVVGEQEAVA